MSQAWCVLSITALPVCLAAFCRRFRALIICCFSFRCNFFCNEAELIFQPLQVPLSALQIVHEEAGSQLISQLGLWWYWISEGSPGLDTAWSGCGPGPSHEKHTLKRKERCLGVVFSPLTVQAEHWFGAEAVAWVQVLTTACGHPPSLWMQRFSRLWQIQHLRCSQLLSQVLTVQGARFPSPALEKCTANCGWSFQGAVLGVWLHL